MADKRTLRPKSARYGCRPSNILSFYETPSSATSHHQSTSNQHHVDQDDGTSTMSSSSQSTKDLSSDAKGSSTASSEALAPTDHHHVKKSGTKARCRMSPTSPPRRRRQSESSKSRSELNMITNDGSTSDLDLLPYCSNRRHTETQHVPYEVVLNASSQKVLDKLKDRQKALSGTAQVIGAMGTSDSNSSQSANYNNSRKLQPLGASRHSHGHPCFQ